MIWTMTGPAGDEGRERREEHGTAVLENETMVSAVKAMANGDDDDDGYEEREGEWTGGMEDSGAAKCSAAAAAIEAAIVNFPLARPLALLINFFDEMRGERRRIGRS